MGGRWGGSGRKLGNSGGEYFDLGHQANTWQEVAESERGDAAAAEELASGGAELASGGAVAELASRETEDSTFSEDMEG